MSDRTIGNAFEKKIIEQILEPAGYRCEKAKPAIIWIPEKKKGKTVYTYSYGAPKPKLRPITMQVDFFKCIDIIAIHPGKPYTLFIQATTGGDTARYERQKKILECKHFCQAAHRVQLWQRDGMNKQTIHIFCLGVTKEGDPIWYKKTWELKKEIPVGIL